MREIIFRGKAVIDFEIDQVCEFWERKVLENGNWIQGDLIWNNGIPFIVHGVIEANDEYISLEWWMPVDPETVGQYTGLTDKNGKKIFEGDIVKCHAIETDKTVIVEDIRKIPVQFKWVDIYDGATIKVIGNIHDKKEDV